MFDRKECKSTGKEKFKANYWRSVLAALILAICAGTGGTVTPQGYGDETQDPSVVTTDPSALPAEGAALLGGAFLAGLLVCLAVRIFVLNPLSVGCYGFFRDNIREKQENLKAVTSGFGIFKKSVTTLLLRDVFLALWTCLFIVPGFIKSYSYRMVPFIIRDHPEMAANEAITKSRQMMNGNKWDVFVFDLSYIGWVILSVLTLGLVGVFWAGPYYQSANADIYEKLSERDGLLQKQA